MTHQKIFGLVVTTQKAPLIDKPEEKDQCYLCGFNFGNENCMFILTDKKLNDRRKVHSKCIYNHLNLLPKGTKIALVHTTTNEILAYTSASEKT